MSAGLMYSSMMPMVYLGKDTRKLSKEEQRQIEADIAFLNRELKKPSK